MQMLRHTQPPADELARLRARIRRLEAREDALRKALISDPMLCRGMEYVATVRICRSRVFLHDKLPAHILSDPAYWSEKVTRQVVTSRAPALGARPAHHVRAGEEDDFDVIEPF